MEVSRRVLEQVSKDSGIKIYLYDGANNARDIVAN